MTFCGRHADLGVPERRNRNGEKIVRYILVTLALAAVIQWQPAAQEQKPLRSGVVLVPITVRVLDRDGNPVRNLKAEDFEVFEDGVRQEVAHCTPHSVEGPSESASGEGATDGHVTNGRTFLFVLGRGDLEGPTRGLTASIEFIKSGLRPADRAGVLAFKRATDLNDRARATRATPYACAARVPHD